MRGPDREQILSADQILTSEYGNLDWDLKDSGLEKIFEFKDFSEAFTFMKKVAEIAEELDHHPDWFNSWNTVKISVINHQAGGITEIDLLLCARINETAKIWMN